ncbi:MULTISPECIES: 3-oxoacyl-[acyl-carrier-protein] synthase III C-terminal domain-containing protein [unclassified Streptomyces]|uniref:3-oxoacyl-[acyl-carrier-protein] synthase III C-terminal domain-containing protein n=1 Tax=unclassified Streptomyces TaxID=2593676 RepID=UPI0036E6A442
MTSLAAVSAYLPAHAEPVVEYLKGFGLSEREIKIYKQYYGFGEVHLDQEVGLAGQLIAAGRSLPELQGRQHLVRYIVQARTMPVIAPYPINPLHEAREALGLTHAQAFALSQQACASVLMSVELAGRMLAEDGDPDALALVFVGEKTFTDDAQVLGVTAVMGEGVAAILVRAGGDRDRVLGFATRTHGKYHRGPKMTPEDHSDWGAAYTSGLTEVIGAALDRAGLDIDEIDYLLPHHVNRLSWLKVLAALGMKDRGRLVMENLPLVGHCFGADPFMNYHTLRSDGRLKPGHRYLMTAVGLGATFSAMVFEH